MSSLNLRPEPWRDGDVVTVLVTAVIGLVTIAGAWFAASRSASVAVAVGWLNLGVAGFVVSGAGMGLWLMRMRRAVGERRSDLVALETGGDEPLDARGSILRPPGSTAELRLVQVPGMKRVHRTDCPLVAGKRLRDGSMVDGELCGVCAT